MTMLRAAPAILAIAVGSQAISCASLRPGLLADQTPKAYLSCPRTTGRPETEVVLKGQQKTLRSGANELHVPNGMRDGNTQVTFATDTLSNNPRVIVTPDRAWFKTPAKVTIDLSHCDPTSLTSATWYVWRFDNGATKGRRLRRIDKVNKRGIAETDHSSYYAIAN